MQFRVGPWRYGLRITRENEALTFQGRNVMALCNEGARQIAISHLCPPNLRIKVLLHELFHAWIFETGEPRSIEGWCDLHATAAVAAIDSLSMNGGREAIARLLPGESPQPGAAKLWLTRTRYCGKCQRAVAGGSVKATPTAPGLVDMMIVCEDCGLRQHWQETLSANGLPTGIVVSGPVFTPMETNAMLSDPLEQGV